MELKDIDIQLQKAASTYKMEVPNDTWPLIRDALHQKKKKGFLWFWFSLLLIGSTTSVLFIKKIGQNKKVLENKSKSTESETSNTEINNIKSKETEITNIKSKDKINKSEYEEKQIFINTAYKKNKTVDEAIKKMEYKNKKIINLSKYEKNKKQSHNIESSLDNTENDVVKNNNNQRNIDVEKEGKEDSIAIKIVKTNIEKVNIKINDTTNKIVQFKKKAEKIKNKKWNFYVGFTTSTLNINDKNVITNNKVENVNFLTISAAQPINARKANYNTGKSIAAFILITPNHNKKIETQLGIQLNYNSFNSKVYSAPATNVYDASGLLQLDTTALSNSFFSDKALNGGTSLNIKNNSFQLGIIVGTKLNLFNVNKSQKIKLQLQLTPTINIAQTINWFDKASGRYFVNKKLNTSFNVNQSTSILWEIIKNKRSISIGPNFNFNLFKLNKKISNLSNIYTNSFGLQLQIKLN